MDSLLTDSLSIVTLAALAVMVAASIFLFVFYLPRLRRVSQAAEPVEDTDDGFVVYPSVSVVVYSQDESSRLRTLLPQIFEQDYPGSVEVIVVSEGQSERTEEVVAHFELEHPNLYLTFTPDGVRNLSRRKLALTLGVKAARNDVVVLTNAGAEIDSNKWLQRMMAPMADDAAVEVVIGYAAPANDDHLGWRRREFYSAVTSVEWLSAALGGRPWRGTGYNLAYRRQTFFDNKGFSRSLNLRDGDDDVFVSQIAKSANTAVVVSPESRLRERHDNPRRWWLEERMRREFTSRFDAGRPTRLFFGACSVSVWVWVAALVMVLAVEIPALIAATAEMPVWDFSAEMFMSPLMVHGYALLLTLALILGLWCPVVRAWRRTLRALDLRPLRWSVPWLMFTRPLVTALLRIRFLRHRRVGYTWSK